MLFVDFKSGLKAFKILIWGKAVLASLIRIPWLIDWRLRHLDALPSDGKFHLKTMNDLALI